MGVFSMTTWRGNKEGRSIETRDRNSIIENKKLAYFSLVIYYHSLLNNESL